ncbi:MAG: hypothetical protein IJT58_07425 [Synergistaceae bacterium]|nr:hypothetical protein [Synergistaceae bacterium]
MTKFLRLLLLLVVLVSPAFARDSASIIDEPYYKIKASIYEAMPKHLHDDEIIFLGDSLTDYVQFSEVFPDLHTKNRAIAGDTTTGVLNRLQDVIASTPAKLFVLIGCNDIVYDVAPDDIAKNIREIISRVKAGSPRTKIYLETIMPVNHEFETRRPGNIINAVNERLPEIAKEFGCTLIDTYNFFAEDDELPKQYTIDGVHFNGSGIIRWMEFLAPYIKE